MPASASHDIDALGEEILRFAITTDELTTPDDVLNRLHAATTQTCHLNVLGALLFPVRWGDWSGVEVGQTVFLHKSAPRGWWEEFIELSRMHPAPGLMLAQQSLAPFTKSEMMRMLEPLGIDRWSDELAIKYGMRDGLTCPVGGRWVVTFWSRKVLSQALSEEARAILFMGATFAAIRLQSLVRPQLTRIGTPAGLTARELAVLRLLSLGHQIREAAELLELGEETVRSHVKKAQTKLGVHTRAHAIAQAIRLHLIP